MTYRGSGGNKGTRCVGIIRPYSLLTTHKIPHFRNLPMTSHNLQTLNLQFTSQRTKIAQTNAKTAKRLSVQLLLAHLRILQVKLGHPGIRARDSGDYIRVIQGVCRDIAKENGNYYVGFSMGLFWGSALQIALLQR